MVMGGGWVGGVGVSLSHPPPNVPPPRNKGLIAGLIKGNQRVFISPDHKDQKRIMGVAKHQPFNHQPTIGNDDDVTIWKPSFELRKIKLLLSIESWLLNDGILISWFMK